MKQILFCFVEKLFSSKFHCLPAASTARSNLSMVDCFASAPFSMRVTILAVWRLGNEFARREIGDYFDRRSAGTGAVCTADDKARVRK